MACSNLANLVAIPAGNTLSGPIVPFPVSLTFRTSLRNEIFHLQIGSARLYNMAGQWSSFELGYTNRDGSIGTDTNLLFVRPLRTLSNGNPIQVRDFTTRSPGIPAATGMGSVFVTLKMADGSVYSSADREERAVIDDGILIVSFNPGSQLTSRILATLTPADTLEARTRTHQVSTSP